MIREISSPHNLFFKRWKKLLVAKGIKEEKLFLVSGEKIVREFCQHHRKHLVCEILPPDLAPISAAENVYRLSRNLFQQLDVFKTGFSIIVASTPEIPFISPRLHAGMELRGVSLILPLSDPNNLGSAIRSAEAFGVDQVILTEEAAHPFLPKAVRAASGSSLRVPLYRTKPLRELEGNFFALSSNPAHHPTPISEVVWPENVMLLVGEEGLGLKALRKGTPGGFAPQVQRIYIPTRGVESLNAGVALGIALYLIRSSRVK